MYTTSAFAWIRDFVVSLLNKSTRCSPRITAEQLYACKQFVAFVLQKTLDIKRYAIQLVYCQKQYTQYEYSVIKWLRRIFCIVTNCCRSAGTV